MKRTETHEVTTLPFDLTILSYELINWEPGADLVFDVHGEAKYTPLFLNLTKTFERYRVATY
jgi:hypothetical protein